MEGNGITILDGGFSTELEKKGFMMNKDPLWSARFLHTDPLAVQDVYESYIKCGCEIITTASYQASLDGFQEHLNITMEDARQLIKLSVELAQKARSKLSSHGSKESCPLIAGSVGPYGVYLADGSEYSGNYADSLTHEELVEWHRPKVQALIEAGVDLVAFETMPSAKEAEALMKLLHDFSGVKAWLSFSTQSDHQIAHGEDIGIVAENCAKIAPASQLVAIGVNCCPPSRVQALLKNISQRINGFPLIAYPNSGEKWVSGVGWVDNAEEALCHYAQTWVECNAKIIGGCCRTGTEEISQLIKTLRTNS